MRHLLLFALLTAPFAASWAVSVEDIDPIDAEFDPAAAARDVARKMIGKSPINWRTKAIEQLKKKGEIFNYFRVETTGMLSTDDTYRLDPEDFDGQIKPSMTAEYTTAQKIIWTAAGLLHGGMAQSALHAGFDYTETESAMWGETTIHAKRVLARFKNLQIDELIAHSWGAEMIYAAIMNGEIPPPKKLIVIGVPDDNFAKWEMLAARTGTEVHYCRADNDKVAQAGAWREKRVTSAVDFKSKWDTACKKHAGLCPANERSPKSVIYEKVGNLPGPDGHGREDYYKILKAKHIIDGNVSALQREEAVRVSQMTRALQGEALESALSDARDLVAQAREARKAARADERRRQGEMSRCWGEMRDFAAEVCSGSSLDTERYVMARECYRTNEAAPWKVLGPTPTPYPGGCQGDLLDEFERHPNADAGGLMSVIMSFQSRASKKASGCQDTMRRIAKAACAAQGGLTTAELDSFYAAADCKDANSIGPTPAEQVIESCAGRLERTLNRRRYSPVEANQLARALWRSFQPPEEEKAATPPRQSIDPDPPQGRGGGRGGLCEDYLGRGNIQCPK